MMLVDWRSLKEEMATSKGVGNVIKPIAAPSVRKIVAGQLITDATSVVRIKLSV
jgi:hypothetical protein